MAQVGYSDTPIFGDVPLFCDKKRHLLFMAYYIPTTVPCFDFEEGKRLLICLDIVQKRYWD